MIRLIPAAHWYRWLLSGIVHSGYKLSATDIDNAEMVWLDVRVLCPEIWAQA